MSVFCESHADLRQPADIWLSKVQLAIWRNPHDLKKSFPSASLLGEQMVVFDLKGNRYRMLTSIDYENRSVLIERIGTHAEYSKWKL